MDGVEALAGVWPAKASTPTLLTRKETINSQQSTENLKRKAARYALLFLVYR